MRFTKFAAFGIFLTTTLLSAEDTFLSLDEAIGLSLDRNLVYQMARLNPEIARESVIGQESVFDMELFASGRVAQSEQSRTFSQVTGTSSDTRNWVAGVRKRLSYGTSVTAQTNLDRRDSNAGVNTSNLSQEADFSVSVRQPLMSGFGRDANTASLERARAAFDASLETYRNAVQTIVANTESAYWSVARWQEQLELNKSSLEVADALLTETRERARVGLATQIDVLQAEASRAERVEEIISTTQSLGDAFDLLLTYMGIIPEAESTAMEPDRKVSPLKESNLELPDYMRVWNLALERDPELAAQQAVITQREWDRVAARSATKPSLDLVLSGGYNGLDDESMRTAVENAIDRDGEFWSVGFEFSMPWSMRGEKAEFRASEKRLQQEELRYEELKQILSRQVRSAWRGLQAVQQSVKAAQLTVSLQEAAFEREKTKYQEGLSAFRNVLEAQRDLDQAEIRLLQSKYNQLEAEIELARLSGYILERHGVTEELLPEDQFQKN